MSIDNAQLQRLLDIHTKLGNGDPLNVAERHWLAELLESVSNGIDVRPRFHETQTGRPTKGNEHFFIALDYLLHLGKGGNAAEKVGKRWNIDVTSVKRIAKEQRDFCNELRFQASDRSMLPALVEMNRGLSPYGRHRHQLIETMLIVLVKRRRKLFLSE